MAKKKQQKPPPKKQEEATPDDQQQPVWWKRVLMAGASSGEKIFVGVAILVLSGIAVSQIIPTDGDDPPNNETGSQTLSEPPTPPKVPTALQAQDDLVPDAKGLVKERVWSPSANTYAEPYKETGAGLDIPKNQVVLVSCKVYWPHPESVSEDGYWYRIETEPWKGTFSPANSYWNGDKPGEKPTHSTNFRVKDCGEDESPDG